MKLAVVILAMIVVISVLIFCFVIRRIRKQIDEMAEVLEDIKNGNGNRRILSETHEIVAPLAYECFILGKHTARNGVAGISPPRREFQKC